MRGTSSSASQAAERAVKVIARRTSNIEHRTPNIESPRRVAVPYSMFDVGCSVFDVSYDPALPPQQIEEYPLKRFRCADREKLTRALLRERFQHLRMRRAVFLINREKVAGRSDIEMRRGF